MKKMICPIFKELLVLSKFSYQAPSLEKFDEKVQVNTVLFIVNLSIKRF